MDCVKLYFKDSLVGVLTYNSKINKYLFIKNKFFNNDYIEEIIGINKNEVYYSSSLFSFFLSFLNRYGNKEYDNEFDELIRIASLDFDKNQFWLGA